MQEKGKKKNTLKTEIKIALSVEETQKVRELSLQLQNNIKSMGEAGSAFFKAASALGRAIDTFNSLLSMGFMQKYYIINNKREEHCVQAMKSEDGKEWLCKQDGNKCEDNMNNWCFMVKSLCQINKGYNTEEILKNLELIDKEIADEKK